ncbi:MAG TPA: hypothetical protein DCS93_05800 [Microscillaceae bacterium]|nr:hypothetical protein [Microscillaceae bacterium]
MQHLSNAYHKIQIYWWYFWEYLRFVDFASIRQSLQYAIWGRCHSEDRLVHSRMGTFACRKNTTDFMYANYNYERKVKKFIQKHLSQYNTFLDVGACIGDYSVWMARQGYKCLTFEPVPTNYEILQKNLHLNDLKDQVHSFPWGLGSRQETVNFEVRPHNKGASKVLREFNPTQTADKNFGTIQSLDGALPQLPLNQNDRVLMKLDVEGMEGEVLKGAEMFIKNCSQLMIIIEATISDQSGIVKLLNQWGDFTYRAIDQHNFAAIKQTPTTVEYTQAEDLKRMKFIVEQTTEHTNKEAKILDVGCGNGNMSLALGASGCEVLGVDISPKAIFYAQKRNPYPNVFFAVKDVNTLIADGKKYDAIVCSEVLEHLQHPEKLLQEIRKLLTTNGVLVVTVPNGKGPRERLVTRPVQWLHTHRPKLWSLLSRVKAKLGYQNTTTQSLAEDLHHIQFFSKKALRKLAKNEGFEINTWKAANFVEAVFPLSFFTKRWKALQRLDCWVADQLPVGWSSGFYMVWKIKNG